jgi:uncharacterized protein (TIGR03382 family)
MKHRAHHSIAAVAFAVALTAAGTASAATLTGDYGGSDLTVAPGDVLDGAITNVGTFTIPAGVVATVGPSGFASVDAQTIRVDGEIDAVGKGSAGGTSSSQSSGTPGNGTGGGAGGIAQQCAHPTGGGGGGYGAEGGAGRNSLNAVFAPGGIAYGDLSDFTDLQQGSGGGGGGSFQCSLVAIGGAGGAGGGAVELRGDTIEIAGDIRVDGDRGRDANSSNLSAGPAGGGGGSAGTIIVVGVDVTLSGTLSARGGDGGDIVADPAQTFAGGGGGGAGGRVKVQWRDSLNDTSTIDVAGGLAGLSGILGGPTVSDDGTNGTSHVTQQNFPPVAQNVSVTTDEGVDAAVVLAATDPNGDTLTYSVGTPTNGTLSGTAPNLVYTPDAQFSGVDTFTFSATDPGGLTSNTATVTVTVLPVNDPPSTNDVAFTTPEDTPYDFVVTGSDPDGDPLTFTPGTPANGTVMSTGNGTFRYTPNPNYFGTDTFDVTVSDGAATAVATVDVVITPVNDPPTAQNLVVTTPEETPVGFTVVASDVDGDPLSFTPGSPPTGSLAGTGPTFTFTPAANTSGDVVFDVVVSDGSLTATAQITIEVTEVNDPPTLADISLTVDEDDSTTHILMGSDPEGDTLSYTAGAPQNGTAAVSGNVLTYTPDANFNGSDTFTVTVSDGTDSATATVAVTVVPVNDAPVAQDLLVQTPEETPIDFTIVASDVDGDPLTFTASAPPSGMLTGAGPTYTYTPATNTSGDVTFEVVVSDGTLSATAQVTIEIDAVNDPPSLSDITLNVDEDDSVSRVLQGTDPENDVLTYTAGSPQNGTASVVGDVLTYTPAPDFNGTDSFQVTVSDGTDSSVARVAVTVRPVNDPPVADDLNVATAEDIDATIVLTGSDIDGDPLTFSVDMPAAGSVSLSGNTAVFTPPADQNGIFTFTYRANDGTVDSAPATVTIDVGPENDPPAWVAPTPDDLAVFMVDEGATVSFVLAADEPDGELVTYDVAPLPAGASFDAVAGTFSWTPEWTDEGDTAYTLSATDGSSTIVRTITISVSVPDTDGDGVPDTREVELGLDPTRPDSDDDTIGDLFEVVDPLAPVDSDGDGIIDALDDDSDDDGLLDRDEAGDDDLTTDPFDRDGDGIPDFLDLDSDADTIDDAVDNCPSVPNADQSDMDRDGVGDLCDTDSDGDGLADPLELSFGFDPGDPDTDGDTIDDFTEFGFGLSPNDSDGDGIFDGLDTDSDDDGFSDAEEAGDDQLFTAPIDTDFDGLADFRDPDSDDDLVDDAIDNCRLVFNTDQTDTDGNGEGDACDGDSDGDGVPDEADNCPVVANPDQADQDNDGVGDACDPVDPVDPVLDVPGLAPIPTGDVVGDTSGEPLPLAPVDDPNDDMNRFANSYFGGAGGCSSTESTPGASLFLFLVAFVALLKRRRE